MTNTLKRRMERVERLESVKWQGRKDFLGRRFSSAFVKGRIGDTFRISSRCSAPCSICRGYVKGCINVYEKGMFSGGIVVYNVSGKFIGIYIVT